MSNNNQRPHALRLIALAGLAVLAVAATATALPLALSHQADTAAGSVSADYHDQAIATCISPATPALPALPAVPAVPVPLPVALPAVPMVDTPSGAAKVCIDASENGVFADASADAMGAHAGTQAGVDTSEQVAAGKQAAGGLKGLLEGIASSIKGLF